MLDEVRRGLKSRLPPSVENAPQVNQGLELYWLAYSDLSTCRTFHGVIPWDAISTYARHNRFSFEQYRLLAVYIREMDSEFQAWEKAQQPQKK